MAAPATILKESLKGTGRPGMGRESGDIEPLTTLRTVNERTRDSSSIMPVGVKTYGRIAVCWRCFATGNTFVEATERRSHRNQMLPGQSEMRLSQSWQHFHQCPSS